MKKTYFLLPVLLLVTGLQSCQKASSSGEDFTQYVEPRIGTAHCRYFHFAPGALPFGMAKPGPSTNGHMGNKDGWEASGYDYRDETIEGFPCVHEFQVGGITLMPVVGEVKMSPTEYRSHYSHDNGLLQCAPRRLQREGRGDGNDARCLRALHFSCFGREPHPV